jgi:hypothetical protein
MEHHSSSDGKCGVAVNSQFYSVWKTAFSEAVFFFLLLVNKKNHFF